jgi:hypothetical protein
MQSVEQPGSMHVLIIDILFRCPLARKGKPGRA